MAALCSSSLGMTVGGFLDILRAVLQFLFKKYGFTVLKKKCMLIRFLAQKLVVLQFLTPLMIFPVHPVGGVVGYQGINP